MKIGVIYKGVQYHKYNMEVYNTFVLLFLYYIYIFEIECNLPISYTYL
jgi:hypothetical protein